ncbi:MAG: DUF3160 domain-containing protein [Candidatus Staskawiczbacteria bacterium]|nr:DUF3160 domain-containing protein [Candidatus Staskawiczbacteria bacterium]
MAEQQLIEYIKKVRQAGQADDQTKALLAKNGWTDQEIGEAFAELARVQTQPVQTQPVQAQPQRPQPQYQAQPAMQPAQNSHLIPKLLIVLIILVVLGGAGYFGFILLNSMPVQPEINNNVSTVSPATATNANFAQYSLETTKFTPAVPEYQLALKDISNLDDFKQNGSAFSKPQTDYLLKNNFFITKNADKFYGSAEDFASRNDDWTALYKTIGGSYNVWEREPQNSVFVSTDFLTHVYHKLIDEEFSYIEESNLYPALSDLSKSMLKSSAENFAKENDQTQKDSYERLSAYFLVTASILDNASADYDKFKTDNFIDDTKTDTKATVLATADTLAKANNITDNAKNIAKQEIGLIFDAKTMISSPLMGKFQPEGMKEDYTQFGPRSHYTKNVILRDYFRAMMFYGRMNFLLSSPELTRDAANIGLILTPDQLKQWESIYQPTAFFVGQTDDLSIYDYNKANTKTGFKASSKDAEAVTKLQVELLTYKNPQIMSSVIVSDSVTSTTKEDLQNTTKGFRFMGQRFTPDAFVFSTLTQGDEAPDPKTGQRLPSMPTALMVSTLLGSKESATQLDTWVKTNAPKSDKVLADRMLTLQDYFNKTTVSQWTQNIYWSWLYTIKSLFTDTASKNGYPMFAKSADWNKKSLQAFLGSWTELKHDTLLYAKQSYAEKGAGGPDEQPAKPVVKGYVEPNIEFFDRLIALANLTTDGLKKFNILPSQFESRNNTFIDSLKFYRKIAVAELQNQAISDEDFEKLRLDAGNLDNILQTPDSQVVLEKNSRSALIADVHTDVVNSKILYEGDGIPNYIYVAVKDANGTRLTKGLVYSYYEFTGPVGKRYTDQVWQGWNYSSTVQKLQLPWWSKDLVK